MNRPKSTRKLVAIVKGLEKIFVPARFTPPTKHKFRQPSGYYEQGVTDPRFMNSRERRAHLLALAS